MGARPGRWLTRPICLDGLSGFQIHLRGNRAVRVFVPRRASTLLEERICELHQRFTASWRSGSCA
jgi:hypothetical protein